jgi:hypothetical protein
VDKAVVPSPNLGGVGSWLQTVRFIIQGSDLGEENDYLMAREPHS